MSDVSPAEYETRIRALERQCATLAAEVDRLRPSAEQLYEALENMLGDWYLFSLAEITRDDINEGSAHDAMKVLKRLQEHRVKDKSLAIGQRQR